MKCNVNVIFGCNLTTDLVSPYLQIKYQTVALPTPVLSDHWFLGWFYTVGPTSHIPDGLFNL